MSYFSDQPTHCIVVKIDVDFFWIEILEKCYDVDCVTSLYCYKCYNQSRQKQQLSTTPLLCNSKTINQMTNKRLEKWLIKQPYLSTQTEATFVFVQLRDETDLEWDLSGWDDHD